MTTDWAIISGLLMVLAFVNGWLRGYVKALRLLVEDLKEIVERQDESVARLHRMIVEKEVRS